MWEIKFSRGISLTCRKVMIFIAMGNLKSAKLIAKFPDAKEAERCEVMLVIIHFSRRYLVVRSTSCATIYECNKIRNRRKPAARNFTREQLKSEKSLLDPLTLYEDKKLGAFLDENQKSVWVRKERRLPQKERESRSDEM
jgi:hypothetical protein